MLVKHEQWRRQPQHSVRINHGNGLGRTVTHCIPLNGSPYEIVRGTALSLASADKIQVDRSGKHLLGNGFSATASVPLDLSSYGNLTLCFSLYWDAYASNDALAMELTDNTNSNNGAFLIDPNSGGGDFDIYTRITSTTSGKYGYITRPSAATWHRYAITIDRTGGSGVLGIQVWVDGIAQSVTAGLTESGDGTNFANSTLYLFSRANTTLYGAGRLQNIVIHGGTVFNDAQAKADADSPWQIFQPERRVIVSLPAVTTPTLSALAASNITSSVARHSLTLTF